MQQRNHSKRTKRISGDPLDADIETGHESAANFSKFKNNSPPILKSVTNEMVPYWNQKVKEHQNKRVRSLSTDYELIGKKTSVRDVSASSNEFEDINLPRKIITVPVPIERTKRADPLDEPSEETMKQILTDNKILQGMLIYPLIIKNLRGVREFLKPKNNEKIKIWTLRDMKIRTISSPLKINLLEC